MINFTVRNLKVFFKDRSAVFFSLLSVFIMIALYALFLGDTIAQGMEGIDESRYLIDSWIVSGLLTVASVTTTMGAFGVMIEDKTKKIVKDFNSSPMSRVDLAGGYILGAYIIGVIMTLFTLVLGEIYILINGGQLMGFVTLLKVLCVILFATFTNVSIVLFVVSFFKSTNAFSTASALIGTLIGFLTGIYIPVGSLPDAVQWVVKLFPVSHAAVLFRDIMLAAPMDVSFKDAPPSARAQFEEIMGMVFKFGDSRADVWVSVAVLAGTALIFSALAVYRLSRKVG